MVAEEGWWGVMNKFVHMEGVEFDGPRLQSAGSSGTTRVVGGCRGGRGGKDRGAEGVVGLAKRKASREGVAVHQLLKPRYEGRERRYGGRMGEMWGSIVVDEGEKEMC